MIWIESVPPFHLGEPSFLQPVCEDKVHPDLSANIYSLDVRINASGPGLHVYCTPSGACMYECLRVRVKTVFP